TMRACAAGVGGVSAGPAVAPRGDAGMLELMPLMLSYKGTIPGVPDMLLAEGILDLQAEMQAIRRDLHAHPELRFEEHRTAGVVAEKLKAWGYEVTTGVGGTGVVGRLRQGSSSRSLGLRADMD